MSGQEIELKKMTIIIAGRSFPVKVSKEEALILPEIEKSLNDQIRQMQLNFKDRDLQDCLSMVLLTQTLSSHATHSAPTAQFEEKIDAIAEEIKSALT